MSILIDMSPENGEAELLYVIRLKDAQSFTLNVNCSDGRWSIVVDDLDQAGVRTIGEGSCFAEAWFNQEPWWAQRRQ